MRRMLAAAYLASLFGTPALAQDHAMGKLMSINEARKEIVLYHDPIERLGLARKSSIFRLENFDALKGIVLGDFVMFEASGSSGELRVTRIEKTDEPDDDEHHH